MIHIEYRLTPQEISEFERAHLELGPVRMPLRRLMARIPFIDQLLLPLVLLVIFGAIAFLNRGRNMESSLVIYGIVFIYVIVQTIWTQYKNRKSLAHSPIIKFDFDAKGFSRTEDFSRQEFAWSHVIHYAETTHLFLLYSDFDFAFVLPKRSFASAGDIDQFRMLVGQQLAKSEHSSVDHSPQAVADPASSNRADTDGLLLSFEYKLEYRDIREFQRKHESIRPGVKWYSRQTRLSPWVGYVFFGLIVGLAIWVAIKSFIEKGFNSNMLPGVIFGGLFLVFGVLLPYRTYRQTKKNLENRLSSRVEIYANRMVIDDRSVVNDLHYYFFKAFAETKNLFVLYFSDTDAIVIPRRALQDPQQALLFRDTVQAGITRTKGFPVQPGQMAYNLDALSVSVDVTKHK